MWKLIDRIEYRWVYFADWVKARKNTAISNWRKLPSEARYWVYVTGGTFFFFFLLCLM